MQKKFISNLFLLLVLNLLVKPLAIFGIDVKVQNELGETIYGNYFAMLNLAVILNIFLDFGINNFTTRTVAQQPHLIEKYAGKVIPIKFFLFLIYSLLGMGIGALMGWCQIDLLVLFILLFNQFLISCIGYGRSHLGGLLEFRSDSIVSVTDKVLFILFAGWILYFSDLKEDFSILWLVGIQTICYLLTLILVVFFLNRKLRVLRLKMDLSFSKAIVKKSLPYAILIFLMFLYTRTDALMLKILLPDGGLQSGIYAQGFRLLDAVVVFAMLFSNLLFPLFSNLFSRKEAYIDILQFSGKLLIGGALAISITVFSHADQISSFLYTSNALEGAKSLQWLALSFIGFSISILFGTVLTANGNLKPLNQIAFLGFGLNVVINFILIPILKAEGAALTTLFTHSLIAILQVIVSFKRLKLKSNSKIIFQFFSLSVLLVAVNFAFKHFEVSNSFIWTLIISGLLLFVTGMIDLKKMKEVFLKDSSAS